MNHDLRIVAAFKRELSDWRLWVARAVVIAVAIAAGLTVVAFTWMTEHALGLFRVARTAWWWLPLIVTPIITGAIVWVVRRHVPGAAGSGIPQVMAALDPRVDSSSRGLFVSLRLTLAKMALTSAGLLGGLSLGREGPSVQVAAGVMLAARRWLPQRSAVTEQGLLVAGGAAGIAAAFNTPLGGVMFAIEELSRSPEQRNSGLIIAAIVLAGLVAVSLFGNGTYFGVIQVPALDVSLLGPGVLVALAGGYLVFLALLWLWCRWLLSRAEADGDWPLDDALELVPSRRGGGGVECGDSGLEAGDIAQGTLELAGSADEGLAVAVPLALVLGIAALIASALSVAVFGLFGVEVLLGVAVEIAFASAGGALAFRARREGWLLHAAGRTWRPMLILLVLAAVLGVVIDRWMPQAGSLPQAVRLLRGGMP